MLDTIKSMEDIPMGLSKSTCTIALIDAIWCTGNETRRQIIHHLSQIYPEVNFMYLDIDQFGKDSVLENGTVEPPYFRFYYKETLIKEESINDVVWMKNAIVEYIQLYSSSKQDNLAKMNYEALKEQILQLVDGERDFIANTSNVASAIFHAFQDTRGTNAVNWAGFYLIRPKLQNDYLLVLGPFMGKPACKRIAIGNGVCGTAAETLTPQLVFNVNEFPAHIACDAKSKSEIVVPVFNNKKQLVAVLDIDCPHVNGFDQNDVMGLTQIAECLGNSSDWNNLTLPVCCGMQ